MRSGTNSLLAMFSTRFQRLSILGKLIFQFAVVVAITLLLYGLLLNFLLTWSVFSLVDRDLNLRAGALQKDLAVQLNNAASVQKIRLPDDGDNSFPDTLIQILDVDGNVILHSAVVGRKPLPVESFVIDAMRQGKITRLTLERRGLWLRVLVVPLMNQDQVIGGLWFAHSLDTLGTALDLLHILLVLVGVLALLGASIWSKQLATLSFQPIYTLALTAERIGQEQDFGQRVHYSGPLDEIGRLAFTFDAMLDKLQKAYQRVEDILDTQKRFITDASHELRTPLTSLRGNVGFLRRSLFSAATTSPDIISTLDDMDDELCRLNRLVNELITLTRADSGQHIAKTTLNLSEVVLNAFRKLTQTLSNVEVALEIESEPLYIFGSIDHLTQVIVILLDNALAFTADGGRIVISLRKENQHAVICVSDNGLGIEPQDLPHIFQRFYRGQIGRLRQSEGSGLGLAIAQWIVSEHNGQIKVNSEVGKGSQFFVYLPLLPSRDTPGTA